MPVQFIPEIHGGDNFDAFIDELMKALPCSTWPCPDPSCDHVVEGDVEAPHDTLADCEL